MLHILILAGGRATRMGGNCPKTLIDIKGKSIIERLLANISEACPYPTIVVGYRGHEIISRLGGRYDYVFQKEQLGTAHAVACARNDLEKRDDITSLLVLYGDHPLVTAKTVMSLWRAREKSGAVIAMATVRVPSFEGDFSLFKDWGRVIYKDDGKLMKVIEVGEARDDEKKITEISPSFFCFDPVWLWANLPLVKNENPKKEYYLTDMVNIAVSEGKKVVTSLVDPVEAMGTNTPEEVAIVSKYFTN